MVRKYEKTGKKPGNPLIGQKIDWDYGKTAPEAEIGVSEDEITAALCRGSFYEFVRTFWHTVEKQNPVWNWHIKYLCDELQAVAERVFRGEKRAYDLLINISPGTTKSTLVSILFPAWIWTRMPSARIINVTYSFHLSTGFSRKSRDCIISDLYRRLYPDIVIRDDQKAKHHYLNTLGGERFATGVDGVVMGLHAHFILVDDPINPKGAVSDAVLNTTNTYMEETLPSRMTDKSVTPTVLVMQRLAENDPAGEMLEQARLGKRKVRHVCLPAELTEDVNPPECRKYYVDGLFDPKRLGHEVLNGIINEFVLASQYLQKPIPRGTATFLVDKIKIEPPPTKFRRLVRAWDKAATLKGGAFTVGTKVGIDMDGRYWVLDVIRVQLDSGRREKLIRETAARDGKKVRVALEQEPGSGGMHSAETTVKSLAGYSVVAVRVGSSDGDKETRAYGASSQVNVGNVSIVSADWNRDWIQELRFFPRSKYKDQVDSFSLGMNLLSGKVVKIGVLS